MSGTGFFDTLYDIVGQKNRPRKNSGVCKTVSSLIEFVMDAVDDHGIQGVDFLRHFIG